MKQEPTSHLAAFDFARPRISVVIPHLNQSAHLARCLASLEAMTRPPDEVIVVDNGSQEQPAAICAAFGARLVTEAVPGPGPARNRGVTAATSEVLAFIDADCVADPAWLEAAEAEMADPDAQILGGDVRIALADPRRMTMIEAYESVYAYRMDRYIAREGFTGTGNLVVRRGVLEEVGPFAGIAVAEDRDWGRRATAGGYKIRYVAGMRVYHPARQSLAELFRKWDRHTAHDFAEARGLTGRLRFLAKTLAMPLSPIVEIPRLMTSDRLVSPWGRLQAFWALVRVRLHRGRTMARLALGTRGAGAEGWNRS